MAQFEDSKLFKLLMAIDESTKDKVAELIQNNVDLGVRGGYDESYLHVLSAPRPDEDSIFVIPIIYQLANAGIEVNAIDKEGNTALHIAALNDVHHSIMSTLIKVGVDPCLINHDDQDALDLVESTNAKSTFEYFEPGLIRAVESKDLPKTTILVNALLKISIDKDGTKLEKIAKRTEMDDLAACVKSRKHTSKLVQAAFGHDPDKTKELMKVEGADYDVQDYSFLREDGTRTKWPLVAETIRLKLVAVSQVLLKKANVNVMIEPELGNHMPLFVWALKYLRSPDITFLKALLKKADMSLIDQPIELMYSAWKNNFPPELVEIFVRQGISLSKRGPNGYTLRDRIFLESYMLETPKLKSHLWFVDRFIVEMVKAGETEKLEKMALDGYDYILVSDDLGRTTLQVAKSEKQKEMVKFLKLLPDFMRDNTTLHYAIVKGNFQEAKGLINEKSIQSRDKAGRTPLHLAVLYERRFIIKHMLKEYPGAAQYKDWLERTPLHFAATFQDGQDIEDALVKAGADEASKDLEGKTAMDYKLHYDIEFIENERNKEYGTEVYLLDRYLAFLEVIDNGELEQLQQMRECMTTSSIDDFNNKLPGKFRGVGFKPLLFICIEKKQEEMAKYFIREGADYNIATKFPDRQGIKQTMTVREAAENRELWALVDFINKRMQKDREEMRAQMAFETAVSSMGDSISDRRSRLSTRTNSTRLSRHMKSDQWSEPMETDSLPGINETDSSGAPTPPPTKKQANGRAGTGGSTRQDGHEQAQQSGACTIL